MSAVIKKPGLFDDGRHVDSMVFVNQMEDGGHGSLLTTLNFVYGETDQIHMKSLKYDETAYRDLTSAQIKADPYLIKTFSYFSGKIAKGLNQVGISFYLS